MYISSDSTDSETENEKYSENNNDNKAKYHQRPAYSTDLFVVLVINTRYVRWETFLPEENIVDIYDLLRDKYKIDDCILEIRDYVLFKSRLRKVAHLCKNGGCTIYVTTKNLDYKLDKDVM